MLAPTLETPSSPDLLAYLRDVELRRVDLDGQTYLDYTGAALYPESLLRQHFAMLRSRTLGNPHSTNPAARAGTDDVLAAKDHVLRYFDADPDEFDVCLTANASGAIKLVGESFPWLEGSHFVLTADNHNSVNGIRELARDRGAAVTYVALRDDLRSSQPAFPPLNGAPGLFAFPAQSNFSGVRHPLSWIHTAHEHGYAVLLDAAAFVPSARLSLRDAPADFVAVSFYKMFGYPTGIGALIARRDAARKLARPWFAGGTVERASVANDHFVLKPDLEAFEDGTVNFLGASAVSLGLSFLERIGPHRIAAHSTALTTALLAGLSEERHVNRNALVRLYGPRDTRDRGGCVAFNILTSNGEIVDCEDVIRLAGMERISLRAGCFCNPGAAESALGLADVHTGAVRASVGFGSNYNDVDTLITFLRRTFT